MNLQENDFHNFIHIYAVFPTFILVHLKLPVGEKKIWCRSRFGRNGALWSFAANLHVVNFESIQMNCMILVRHSEFWGLEIQTHFGNSIGDKVTRLYEY